MIRREAAERSRTAAGRNRRVLLACLLLAAVVACGLGCSNSGASRESTPIGADPVLRVSRGTFQGETLLTGELRAVKSTRIIVPRIPNWQMPIRWIEEDGVQVEPGQPVLELDNSQFTGELEQMRLAADSALNNLMQKEADLAVRVADQRFRGDQARIALEKARIEGDVPESIFARSKYQELQLATARAEIALQKAEDQLEADREAADAELEELRIALRKAQRDVETAERSIDALTLRAPAAGILVIGRNRREGRKYQTGDNVSVGEPVAEIPDLSAMKVEARLSDVDDGKIAPGMRAVSTLDTFPELAVEGTVTEIGPVATEDSRNSLRRGFEVTVMLDAADAERMRPGMSVRSEVIMTPRTDVLLVPRIAVRIAGGQARARLAGGERVPFEVGPCSTQLCEVLAGLDEDQRLEAWR